MSLRARWLLAAGLVCALLLGTARADELSAKQVTLQYDSAERVRQFNKKVRLKSLWYAMWKQEAIDPAAEVAEKVDAIADKVQNVLEMFPENFHVRLVLLADDRQVQDTYREKFDRRANFIAFYAPEDQAIYLSVEHIDLGVLAHEMAHAVIDQYFEVPAPVKIHELLAQYAEIQLTQ